MAKTSTRLGVVMRRWRDDNGYTVEEAAAEAGISPGKWSKLETGNQPLGLTSLVQIATVLGRTLGDVAGLAGIPVPQTPQQLEEDLAALEKRSPTARRLLEAMPGLTEEQLRALAAVAAAMGDPPS